MATQTVAVAAGSDDALSFSASLGTISGVQTTDTSAILGKFVNNFFYEVYVLFKSLDFAQGDTIDSCTVEFELAGNSIGGGNDLEIYWSFHDTDNASAVASTSDAQTAYDNQTTQIAETFTSSSSTTPTRLTSPELKTLLQEISDRGGWSANNDILLLMTYKTSTGQDYMQPFMYDSGGGADKMEITVEYSTPTPPARRIFNIS
jgi:hypothetical protein